MTTMALLTLNPRSREARRSLSDPQALHKALMGCFPSSAGDTPRQEFGVLWRAEPSDAPTILMQSRTEPDLQALPPGFATAQTRPLDRHLAGLANGQVVHYRVVLNPVAKSRARGNRQRVIPSSERAEWAAKRLMKVGLDLLTPPTLTGLPSRYIERSGKRLPIYATQVDGIGRVMEADALCAALKSGVGHAKAWGCGLMTVLRANA